MRHDSREHPPMRADIHGGSTTMAGQFTGRKVRVEVIGAGAWENRSHIHGWARDPRAKIVAVCDTNRALAEAAAAKYRAAVVSDDFRAVVDRNEIDVVDVATPSHTHFELAMAALDAGKHVLCEKPVAFDFRET